ncbi:hypothetical protein NG895_27740 [Aeoliella sp. ICT_H6.2]|uniref:Uncharacterized protein n=1 Tax=Aeoliella straminimaris TaxID=2954799 RepID=A0A9X2JKZ1_9BACT|nr:hypothetical protein [Aeoliella straminimaris]MCO6047714.1 hypothetical protein [Aeoliella straminimaris]
MRLTHWLPSCVLAAALTTIGCTGAKMAHNLPPAQQLMEPGPGVGGPGPGVIPVPGQYGMGGMGGMGAMGGMGPGGAMGPGGMGPGGGMGCMTQAPTQNSGIQQVGYCEPGGGGMPGMGMPGMPATSQISFLGEEPLQVNWDVSGQGCFDSSPLFVPGKQDFYQGAIYRLKVSNLPGRETVVLYPTLEVAPVTPRTDAYLAHAPIPVQFTEEDFDQVLSGNFVTKVIYLPDPEFTEVALAGVETLVSTRLDPGVDPIAEADRRGSILAILRMGNKDLSKSPGMCAGGSCVTPAQYTEGPYSEEGFEVGPEHVPAPADGQYMGEGYVEGYEGGYVDGGYAEGYSQGGSGCYGGGYDAAMSQMPMGAPTAGMGLQGGVPPHMVANMAPAYGMPITGTPIGLPGPPHIPLGVPAGLKKHSMRNRTRVVLPDPVHEMKMTVKQRPGMNYPAPVDHVRIDEVNRAPKQMFGGTVPGLIPAALNKSWNHMKSAAHNADCQCEYCQ